MTLDFTPPQVEALLLACIEVEAGDMSDYSPGLVRAFRAAIAKLRVAHNGPPRRIRAVVRPGEAR